jgi:lipopolysaccharide export system permease protein
MFKIVYKHLAYNFIVPFVTSGFFFIIFLLIFQIFRIIDYIIEKDVDLLLVFKLLGNIAISYVPNAIPLAILFAVVYTLGKLSEDSELIAMRSFGYSKYRLFAPFFVMGIVISMSIYSLTQVIIPNNQKAFKVGVMRLTSKSLLANIKKNEFFVDIPQTVFYAEDKKEKDYYNVFISRITPTEEKAITAYKGTFIKQKYDEWGAAMLRMKLYDGNIVEYAKNGEARRKILFDEYEFPIMGESTLESGSTKLSTKTTDELEELLSKQPDKNRKVRILLEYWERINNSTLPLLFLFVGFSLGIKQGRGRGRSPVLLAFLILISYYVLYFIGISLAKKMTIAPMFAVFGPQIILTAVGAYHFKKLNWLS